MWADEPATGQLVSYVDGKAVAIRLRRCRLEVVGGPDRGLIRDFEHPLIRIGTRRIADFVLTDNKVSGLHLEISLDERGFRLRDLDSKNGTWIAGHRTKDIYVNPGTNIFVGDSRIRFQPLDDSVEVPLSLAERFGKLIGRSIPMRELFGRLERIAAVNTTVLLTGETGTGKEIVAEAIHSHSPRASGPLIVVDCGAIPINLVESELFGHEKGAFTGADSAFVGAFERAHGGTIFLDEVAELPVDLQPKLLRALEQKEVRRIGGTRTRLVDIRVVAATNRNLAVEVARSRFREDLYYRLAVVHLHLPPLRDRREDIPLLVDHFLSRVPNMERTSLRPETIELMLRHDWPGNVRELRNVVERAAVLADVPTRIRALANRPGVTPVDGNLSSQGPDGAKLDMAVDLEVPFKEAKQQIIDEFEGRYVRRLLDHHKGNVSAAARAAGLDRMSMHKIINRLKRRGQATPADNADGPTRLNPKK
ncbi:MAG: sigma 54-interacting transcriptional regulator [Pseudomonadota bacterium]